MYWARIGHTELKDLLTNMPIKLEFPGDDGVGYFVPEHMKREPVDLSEFQDKEISAKVWGVVLVVVFIGTIIAAAIFGWQLR